MQIDLLVFCRLMEYVSCYIKISSPTKLIASWSVIFTESMGHIQLCNETKPRDMFIATIRSQYYGGARYRETQTSVSGAQHGPGAETVGGHQKLQRLLEMCSKFLVISAQAIGLQRKLTTHARPMPSIPFWFCFVFCVGMQIDRTDIGPMYKIGCIYRYVICVLLNIICRGLREKNFFQE